MSRSADSERATGAPSNAELAERTARIEESVTHVEEVVERIEERVVDEQSDLADQVEDNRATVTKLYLGYTLARFVTPLLLGSGGVFVWVAYV